MEQKLGQRIKAILMIIEKITKQVFINIILIILLVQCKKNNDMSHITIKVDNEISNYITISSSLFYDKNIKSLDVFKHRQALNKIPNDALRYGFKIAYKDSLFCSFEFDSKIKAHGFKGAMRTIDVFKEKGGILVNISNAHGGKIASYQLLPQKNILLN